MRKQISLLALVILGAATMYGQASRTWVSGVGDDANPCSRTAPCKTWAGAISKTAAGGEIDALDPGGFGAVTITKSITIDGGGGQVASVLVAGTNGIVVQAGASDVVILRNLRVNGLLNSGNPGINGIRWLSGKTFHVESCTIFGFNSSAIDIEKADGGKAFITNSVLTNNALAGVLVKNTSNTVSVTVSKSVIADNAFGIASQDFSHTVVFESEISGSSNTGLQTAITAGGTATMDVFNTVVANNSLGMSANASSTINISGVGFFGNSVSMVSPGTINTAHNNPNTGTGSPNGVTPIPLQ